MSLHSMEGRLASLAPFFSSRSQIYLPADQPNKAQPANFRGFIVVGSFYLAHSIRHQLVSKYLQLGY